MTTQQYGVFDAIPRAIEKTWDMSVLTLRVLWKMVSGEASLANISGPITIAKYAGVTAQIVDQRDEAFGYADRFDEKYDLVRTLRKGRYEYVRSYQPFNFDGDKVERPSPQFFLINLAAIHDLGMADNGR